MMYLRLLIAGSALLIGSSALAEDFSHTVIPAKGFIPDEETAVKVAIAILTPVYGDMENEKPFIANLNNDIWTVKGSLPKGYKGGTALIMLSKASGSVLRMTHSR